MRLPPRRIVAFGALVVLEWTAAVPSARVAAQRRGEEGAREASEARLTQVIGRPTGRSITVSVLSPTEVEAYVEYGVDSGDYVARTDVLKAASGVPLEIAIDRLLPDTRYHYRLRERQPGEPLFREGQEHSFHTQRAPGRAFTFALQGDSHPERLDRMFDPALYRRTLGNVQKDQPDFYLMLGDDFSVDPLVNRAQLNRQSVDRLYVNQRGFLGGVASSAALFLVNGNHEQAARYLLDGTQDSLPLLSGGARTRFFPLPAPDGFYSGDEERVEGIGLLRDYYAWSWGDALFVVIDPYWHSPVQVDAPVGGARGEAGKRRDGGEGRQTSEPRGQRGGGRGRDWWGMTIGDAQYQWLKKTLEQSQARHKFVFAHHVLGTGRGGVEMADLYEWGGRDRSGAWQFGEKRRGWELPIHQLMVRTGVTAFFQGHDHLFARQERDGVVYQAVPSPADPTYQAFNRVAYRSGDILPNSGHLRVTVSPDRVKVDYVRAWLPQDETGDRKNGAVVFSYTLEPRRGQ